jgi:hypothetical protein
MHVSGSFELSHRPGLSVDIPGQRVDQLFDNNVASVSDWS